MEEPFIHPIDAPIPLHLLPPLAALQFLQDFPHLLAVLPFLLELMDYHAAMLLLLMAALSPLAHESSPRILLHHLVGQHFMPIGPAGLAAPILPLPNLDNHLDVHLDSLVNSNVMTCKSGSITMSPPLPNLSRAASPTAGGWIPLGGQPRGGVSDASSLCDSTVPSSQQRRSTPMHPSIHTLLDDLMSQHLIHHVGAYHVEDWPPSIPISFALQKSPSKSALIFDLRLQNALLPRPPHTPVTTPFALLSMLHSHNLSVARPLWFVKSDLANCFWSYKQATHTPFVVMCTCHGAQVYCTDRLPFGHSWSPFLAQMTMLKHLLDVPLPLSSLDPPLNVGLVYDDLLLADSDPMRLQACSMAVRSHINEKGLLLSEKKSSPIPVLSLPYVGLQLTNTLLPFPCHCFSPHTFAAITPSSSYLLTMIHAVAHLHYYKSALSKKCMQRLCGQLQWVAATSPLAYSYHSLTDRHLRHRWVFNTPALLRDFLRSCLSLPAVRAYHAVGWLNPSLQPSTFDGVFFVDASLKGIAVTICLPNLPHRVHFRPIPPYLRRHGDHRDQQSLELYGCLSALRWFCSHAPKLLSPLACLWHLAFISDSTSALHALIRGGGRILPYK